MADRHSFSITCDSGLAAALRRAVQSAREAERSWWEQALTEVREEDDPAARRVARAALEAERARRRASGESLASRDALLRHHLVAVLAENGWHRKWTPIPAGEASIPGRRWGVPLRNEHRTGDGRGRLICNLPPDLWEQVRRTAYWVSAPHVAELQRWHRRFGDGPGAARRAGPLGDLLAAVRAAGGGGPRREDLDRREELRAKIVTTGDILRMAAARAVA